MVELPASFSRLPALRALSLTTDFETIQQFQNLTGLAELDLNLYCDEGPVELPDAILKMASLEILQLSSPRLSSLPAALGTLRALKTLAISAAHSLQRFPDSIGNLRKLRTLSLSACGIIQTLPESIGLLIRLEKLEIFECDRFKSLPDSIGNLNALRQLFVTDCDEFSPPPPGFFC
jgi:Leucine-rich repeat (LRR) protein